MMVSFRTIPRIFDNYFNLQRYNYVLRTNSQNLIFDIPKSTKRDVLVRIIFRLIIVLIQSCSDQELLHLSDSQTQSSISVSPSQAAAGCHARSNSRNDFNTR